MSTQLGFEEKAGWQALWQQQQRKPENLIERDRRYGRVFEVFDEDCLFVVRIELPRESPNHPWLYQYDLPKVLAPYQISTETTQKALIIHGTIQDRDLAKLCGLINSFPDRFVIKLPIDFTVKNLEIIFVEDYIVDIKVAKQ